MNVIRVGIMLFLGLISRFIFADVYFPETIHCTGNRSVSCSPLSPGVEVVSTDEDVSPDTYYFAGTREVHFNSSGKFIPTNIKGIYDCKDSSNALEVQTVQQYIPAIHDSNLWKPFTFNGKIAGYNCESDMHHNADCPLI